MDLPINHQCLSCGAIAKSKSRLIELFGFDQDLSYTAINRYCKFCRGYYELKEKYFSSFSN